MRKNQEPDLRRELGANSLALNAVNLTIGAGIFVLPAIVAENLGRSAFVAYLICGALVVLIMLCYAEIGSKVTTTGGSYAYVESAFGPFVGFLINTLLWFGFSALADAAVVNALTDMLAIWFPVFDGYYVRVLFFILIFGFLAGINIRGVKEGANFAIAATILKLAPLIFLILIGFFHISADNLTIKTWPAIGNVGDTALVLFFAFVGIETALNVSGEIKNPQKSIPRGIFMAVFGILTIYLLLQFVGQGVLGDQLAANKDAPLAAIAVNIIGPIGGTIILVTSVVSMFGMLSGDVLASPRVIFAASKDKLLPGFLGRVHPKFATPYWSILVYSGIGLILASSGGFKQLAVYASSSILIVYLFVVLAMVKMRYKKTENANEYFKVRGGLVVPFLAVVTICWFLSHITITEIIATTVFFVALGLWYFLTRKFRSKSSL